MPFKRLEGLVPYLCTNERHVCFLRGAFQVQVQRKCSTLQYLLTRPFTTLLCAGFDPWAATCATWKHWAEAQLWERKLRCVQLPNNFIPDRRCFMESWSRIASEIKQGWWPILPDLTNTLLTCLGWGGSNNACLLIPHAVKRPAPAAERRTQAAPGQPCHLAGGQGTCAPVQRACRECKTTHRSERTYLLCTCCLHHQGIELVLLWLATHANLLVLTALNDVGQHWEAVPKPLRVLASGAGGQAKEFRGGEGTNPRSKVSYGNGIWWRVLCWSLFSWSIGIIELCCACMFVYVHVYA